MPQQPLNILVFIGSPRNEESWTYKSIRIIEAKMQAIQPVEFEYVFVAPNPVYGMQAYSRRFSFNKPFGNAPNLASLQDLTLF